VELALWKFDFTAEFERTFARLCLPSGADLAELQRLRGEPPKVATPAGNGAGDDRTVLLRVYVDRVEDARPAIEAVLARDAKRWTLEQVAAGVDGPPLLTYRVRARKSVGMDALRERLLREGAPHVVAADEPPPGS